jgi:uncharacterized DUF497 family protein
MSKGRSLGSFQEFEWDEVKRKANLEKHGIDFEDSQSVFDSPYLVKEVERGGERRYAICGLVNDVEIVVICTLRAGRCRLISARRARTHERKEYHLQFKTSPEKG